MCDGDFQNRENLLGKQNKYISFELEFIFPENINIIEVLNLIFYCYITKYFSLRFTYAFC